MSRAHRSFPACLILLLCACLPCLSYPQNLLSAKLGASVSTSAQIEAGPVDAILSDEDVSKGGFYFTKTKQDQVFTADLGAIRTFDRVQFGSASYGTDRSARRLMIAVSTTAPEGPFRTVFSADGIGYWQVFRLREVSARWVRFGMGHGADGAHVHSVRIYKGYRHPDLATVTQLLRQRISRGIPELKRFYAAADRRDWTKACRLLRTYYRDRDEVDPPNPKYDLSRAQSLADGKLDFADILRHEKVPIDWSYSKTTDWYEHKNFLNRGAPLGVFVDAYWNTGHAVWAKQFRDIFYDWLDANPKPEVMHRADYPTWRTLDSALRSQWLVSRFAKVTHGRDIDDELWANWLYSIWEHADYLKDDQFDGGNWLAMVSSAVMEIALKYPEFVDKRTWMAFGKQAFETNVLRDIYPDGKECEDSPGYVCMAYAGMFGTLRALDTAGIDVNPEVRRRMNKVLDFIGAALQPNNIFPNMGDGGGPIGYDLFGPQRYFEREDTRYILTQGKEGTAPAEASVNFRDGGWSIMRSSYEERPYENARHMVFKSSSGSHGHLDMLSVTLYAYGRELLIDPGISSYEAADVQRYLQTSYHNTVCVDGRDQSRGGGRTERWLSNGGMDYLVGSHVGYKGVTHRRTVLFVKPEYWLVFDEMTGEGEHTCDQNWHFPADARIAGDQSSGAVYTRYERGGNLLVAPVTPNQAKAQEISFLISGNEPGEARDTPAKGWCLSTSGSLPQQTDVVLYPYNGSTAPQVAARRLELAPGSPAGSVAVEVRVGDRTDYIAIRPGATGTVSVPDAGLEADGEVVMVRVEKGKPVEVRGSNVKSVMFGGESLANYAEPAADIKLSLPPAGSR